MSDSGHSATPSASDDDVEEDRSRQPLSQFLDELSEQTAKGRLTILDLVAWFQDRATLALMMIFGILNIPPSPPGSSIILGLPML